MFKSLVLVTLLMAPASNPSLGLSISPRFTHPGQKIKASMFIPESPTPREACLVWSGENEEGRKCWTHDNENDFPTGHFSYPIMLHYQGSVLFQLQVVADKLYTTPTVEVEVLD